MAKYIVNDIDYKILDTHQKASFNEFVVNYDIDKNTEVTKGKDTLYYLWNVILGKETDTSIFKVNSINELYTFVYTLLITLDVIAIIDLAIVFIYYLLTYLVTQNPIRKVFVIIILKMFIFIIGMVVLISLFTRLKDNVQSNVEKILLKL